MTMALFKQQKKIEAQELKNKILCDEHRSFQDYVMVLEKEKVHSSEYRYRLIQMMSELQRYMQPTHSDKVAEMEARERARDLLHETCKFFENSSEGGELDFASLRARMEKVYAKQRQEVGGQK